MEAHIHMVVQGLVQGVGFRWYVAQKAQSLGLKGFVKNLYDGSVEIEAEGNRSLIEELINDVRVGPRSAHVKGVRLEWSTPQNQQTGFEIL